MRDTLPLKLLSSLQSHNSRGNGATGSCFRKGKRRAGEPLASVKDCSSEDPFLTLWRDAFHKSYKSVDKELRSHPSVDCFCSGSTAVTLVKHVSENCSLLFLTLSSSSFFFSHLYLILCFLFSKGLNLFIGYIGDSRAVLGSRDVNDSMVAVQLTVDLKPNLPSTFCLFFLSQGYMTSKLTLFL